MSSGSEVDASPADKRAGHAVMVCAQCGEESPVAKACRECLADPRLDERYRLTGLLGRGGGSATFRGVRLEDGLPVCIRELSLGGISSLAAVDELQAEADTLRQLDHRNIPGYVDDFTAGEGRELAIYLVQELVDGESLAAELEHRRYTEIEVLETLDELLSILEYLQDLRPPMVHRDISPRSVLRRASDGRLALVEFGSVRDLVRHKVESPDALAMGTLGQMAPEQLNGNATVQTDLYAVGVLAVVLLSRRDPADMLDDEGQLAWELYVDVHSATRAFLWSLLRLAPAKRPADARAARWALRDALEQLRAAAPPPPELLEAPLGGALQAPDPVLAGLADPAADLPAPEPRRTVRRGSASGWGVILGVALSVLGGAAAAYFLLSAAEPVAADGEALPVAGPGGKRVAAPACEGQDCRSLSEPFLRRLEFGMLEDTARRARGEVEVAQVVPASPFGPARAVPGKRLEARVRLANETADCVLDFRVRHGLSELTCTLSSLTDAARTAATQRLRERMAALYGEPERPDKFMADAWRWRSQEGVLVLASDEMRRTVTLTHSSAAHLELVRTLAEHEKRHGSKEP